MGGLYRRTRADEYGRKVQRAEIRFDDVSGCLRTPAGGSSRQTIVVVDGATVKARLISSRETARLMGLPETYKLPENYNEAYHLTGDGVVVPVVRHLAEHTLSLCWNCTGGGRLPRHELIRRTAHGRIDFGAARAGENACPTSLLPHNSVGADRWGRRLRLDSAGNMLHSHLTGASSWCRPNKTMFEPAAIAT